MASELEGKVEELKQQLADQEYERAEIINRMTTERSKWELERSGMQSHINQVKLVYSKKKQMLFHKFHVFNVYSLAKLFELNRSNKLRRDFKRFYFFLRK